MGIAHFRLHAFVAAVLLLQCIALCAEAATGEISSVEPQAIRQGDTVMLSIKGSGLPQNGPVVEFFPQQIAVLSILSSSSTEILAQVKVPNLAAPGLYNILIYNQMGDEAFAKGLLTVESSVLTPVFKDYDPKVIAQADSGFALMLTGESISSESASHLSIAWELAGERQHSLRSSFSRLDASTVVCAVSGKPPGGVLRGTVKLDDKPIYLVEVTVLAESGVIVGHAPAALMLGTPPYIFKLLGSELSPQYLERLKVKLNVNGQLMEASKLSLRDKATIAVEFSQALPLGTITLQVEEDGEKVYEGEIVITDSPPMDIAPEDEAPADPLPPAEPPGNLIPGDPYGLTQTPKLPELDASVQADSTQAGSSLEVLAIQPESYSPGADSQKFTITFAGGYEAVYLRVEPRLLLDGTEAQVLFKGATGSVLTCIFSTPMLPAPAQSCRLELSDPLGEFAPYMRDLAVEGLPQSERTVQNQPAGNLLPENSGSADLPPGEALNLRLASNKIEIDTSGFRVELFGADAVPQPAMLEDVKLSSDLLLLDRNMEKFSVVLEMKQDSASPIIGLHFRRSPEFDDELYDLFMEQLRAEIAVSLSLSWDALGTSVQDTVTFVSSEELLMDDLMNDL